MKAVPKILICRSDNLGDLLLSLPAIKKLRMALPDCELGLLAKRPNLTLLKSFLREHNIQPISLEEDWQKQSWDVFLSLFSTWEMAARAFLGRIPLRLGPYSKAWSFLFFNEGKRQKRSSALKSEGAYCIELVDELLKKVGGEPGKYGSESVLLPFEKEEAEQAEQALTKIGIGTNEKFITVHPGMAGSALNLSQDQYLALIKKLSQRAECVVSVGPSQQDQAIWKFLEKNIPNLKKIEGLNLSALKEVFRRSWVVIAPSTGPLHLAHLVGVPAIGLYSPVKAHHPNRWAPQGGAHPAIVHFPQVKCPGKSSCIGNSCLEFNCMEKMDWASLILKELDGLT